MHRARRSPQVGLQIGTFLLPSRSRWNSTLRSGGFSEGGFPHPPHNRWSRPILVPEKNFLVHPLVDAPICSFSFCQWGIEAGLASGSLSHAARREVRSPNPRYGASILAHRPSPDQRYETSGLCIQLSATKGRHPFHGCRPGLHSDPSDPALTG